MNTAGGFDGDNGVHNVSLPQCADGLNTCFLRVLPLHPRVLSTTQHRDRGEATPGCQHQLPKSLTLGMLSPPGLPAGPEDWGQEGMAEGTAGTGACGDIAGSCTGHGALGSHRPVGSCSAAGCGGILASHHGTGGADWEAGMHRGLYPGFYWSSLGSSGRMSRVGVPAWDGLQQAGAQ